ncbi:MAG TPA: hypothetical protein V6C86_14895 [Oculatellaceae cyanobacterium]
MPGFVAVAVPALVAAALVFAVVGGFEVTGSVVGVVAGAAGGAMVGSKLDSPINVLPGVNEDGNGVSCSLCTTPPVSIRLLVAAGLSSAKHSEIAKLCTAKQPNTVARYNDVCCLV